VPVQSQKKQTPSVATSEVASKPTLARKKFFALVFNLQYKTRNHNQE
jgi:hypothetical protein